MSEKNRRLGVTLLFIIILILGIGLLDFYNSSLSHYVQAEHHVVDIRHISKDKLYSISGMGIEDGVTTFEIVTDKPVALAFNHLKYDHSIYFNGRLVSQNIDKTSPNYDYRYAYKVLPLNEPTRVTLTGERNYTTSFYVADPETMDSRIETRTFFFSAYVVIYSLVSLICLALFLLNRQDYQFLILMCHAIIVLIKVVIKGDLFFLTELLHVTLSIQYGLHVFTGILWTIFPAFVVMSHYRIPVSKGIKIALSLIFTAMLILGVLMDYSVNAVYIMLVSLPFFIYVIYYGIYHKKPFYMLVTFACIFQGSHSFYMALCGAHVLQYGELSFILYPVGNGLTGFILIFTAMYVYNHYRTFVMLNEQALEYEKVNILRGIGHDLKLPLSVIKSSNDIIHHYDLEDSQRQIYLDRSSDAIKELEMMVANIGHYMDKTMTVDQISIGESIKKFSKQFQAKDQGGYKRVHFADHTEDALIGMDYFSFYRILFNLVDNAIKYSDRETEVHVDYDIGDRVLIYVKDQGIGMTKEEIQKSTGAFYRANQARTENGMGMGLAVVKTICDKHGVEIKIMSKKNDFTTVRLDFPLYKKS